MNITGNVLTEIISKLIRLYDFKYKFKENKAKGKIIHRFILKENQK